MHPHPKDCHAKTATEPWSIPVRAARQIRAFEISPEVWSNIYSGVEAGREFLLETSGGTLGDANANDTVEEEEDAHIPFEPEESEQSCLPGPVESSTGNVRRKTDHTDHDERITATITYRQPCLEIDSTFTLVEGRIFVLRIFQQFVDL